MRGRKYYEAYDDRYRQVHSKSLQWFAEMPSEIISQVMAEFDVRPTDKIL